MRARQEWDARIGSAVVHARNWRLATFASLGLLLVALVATIILGRKPKAVLHIVEVDKLGAATYVGPAGRTAGEGPSELSIKYHLTRFVEDTRSISSDLSVIKRSWLEAYALVTPAGANMLSAYVENHDPFRRSQTERVSVETIAAVAVSKDTWQIDWRETTWDLNGTALGTVVWRGMFRVVFRVPDTEEKMAKNPLGLYVDEFHWDKVRS